MAAVQLPPREGARAWEVLTATAGAELITLGIGVGTWTAGRGELRSPWRHDVSDLRIPADSLSRPAVPPVPGSRSGGPSRGGLRDQGRKPSVFQVGKVRDDGRTVVISGWGLGLCAAGCACHRHPRGTSRHRRGPGGGRLGLATFADAECGCCEPWTADELAAILRDLGTVAGLQSRSRSPAEPDRPLPAPRVGVS